MNFNFKNILTWVIRIGLLIIPFVPLYIAAGLFFPFIVGKAFVFRLIVEIVFALWLMLLVFYKEFRPKKNSLLWAISIFIGVATLATVMGVNPLRSFWSNFERMEGLVMHLHLFGYFLVLGNVFKKRDWLWFFNAFILSGLIEGFYGLMQKTGVITGATQGGFRVDGTIGNPTYLAAFLIFIIGFCILLFLKSKNIYVRAYYAFSALFSLMIIYFTASRGPALGVLIALVLVGISYLFLKKAETDNDRKIKKILFGVLIGLIALVGILWGLKNTDFVTNNPTLSRLTSLSFSERTITSRFSIWQMSFEAFKERPILGWGPENYVTVFSKYYTPEMWIQEPWFDRSHNIIFDWLINAGLLGLLSYLSIFFFAIRQLYKNYQSKKISFEEMALVVGVFMAYFFQSLFVFDNIATYISFFAILAWIYSVSTEEERLGQENEKPTLDINYFPIVIFTIFLVASFYAYQINVKPYRENKFLINAMISSNKKAYATSFDYYQKAFDIDTFLGRFEVLGQLVNSAMSAFRNADLSEEKKQEIFNFTAEKLEEAKTQNSLDPRPFMYAGLFYDTVNKTDLAVENMILAQSLSPKKQDIAIDLGGFYINAKQYDKALPILISTFEADKAFTTARTALVQLYILMGNQLEADRLLMEGFGKLDVTDNSLIKAYYLTQQYGRMVDIWKAYVVANPKNLEYRQSLAGAYLINGQKDMAIKALQGIIEVDPSTASRVNELINQVLQEQ